MRAEPVENASCPMCGGQVLKVTNEIKAWGGEVVRTTETYRCADAARDHIPWGWTPMGDGS
jgi:hypothetical protein